MNKETLICLDLAILMLLFAVIFSMNPTIKGSDKILGIKLSLLSWLFLDYFFITSIYWLFFSKFVGHPFKALFGFTFFMLSGVGSDVIQHVILGKVVLVVDLVLEVGLVLLFCLVFLRRLI